MDSWGEHFWGFGTWGGVWALPTEPSSATLDFDTPTVEWEETQ